MVINFLNQLSTQPKLLWVSVAGKGDESTGRGLSLQPVWRRQCGLLGVVEEQLDRVIVGGLRQKVSCPCKN